MSNPPTTQPVAETSEGACINTGKCPTGLCEINGLCLPKPTGSVDSFVGKTTLVGLLLKIIQFLLTFAGVVAVGVLVIGGFWYITSAGNEQAEKGQKAITNAIIGLVVVILAYTIVAIISSTCNCRQICKIKIYILAAPNRAAFFVVWDAFWLVYKTM